MADGNLNPLSVINNPIHSTFDLRSFFFLCTLHFQQCFKHNDLPVRSHIIINVTWTRTNIYRKQHVPTTVVPYTSYTSSENDKLHYFRKRHLKTCLLLWRRYYCNCYNDKGGINPSRDPDPSNPSHNHISSYSHTTQRTAAITMMIIVVTRLLRRWSLPKNEEDHWQTYLSAQFFPKLEDEKVWLVIPYRAKKCNRKCLYLYTHTGARFFFLVVLVVHYYYCTYLKRTFSYKEYRSWIGD